MVTKQYSALSLFRYTLSLAAICTFSTESFFIGKRRSRFLYHP